MSLHASLGKPSPLVEAAANKVLASQKKAVKACFAALALAADSSSEAEAKITVAMQAAMEAAAAAKEAVDATADDHPDALEFNLAATRAAIEDVHVAAQAAWAATLKVTTSSASSIGSTMMFMASKAIDASAAAQTLNPKAKYHLDGLITLVGYLVNPPPPAADA